MFRAPPLPRTLAAALRDLESSRVSVRVDAAREIVPHAADDREPVVRALSTALRDQAAEVRSAAALSLADLAAGEALGALLVAVDDDNLHVRQMAITALGEIGDPRATERLRRALRDERAEVRFQTVIAFPRVCSSRDSAIEALIGASRDDDPLVSHIALRMAEELGEAEGAVDPRFVLRAKALLLHDAPVVRVAAAILLARAGDNAGRAVLADVARGEIRTSEGDDEAAAVELCGELGITEAREGLERRAFGSVLGLRRDRFAWHARVALARMGHERARRDILTELGARDRDRRTLAVAAAGRARLQAARDRLVAMRGDVERADPDAVKEALAALDRAEDD